MLWEEYRESSILPGKKKKKGKIWRVLKASVTLNLCRSLLTTSDEVSLG